MLFKYFCLYPGILQMSAREVSVRYRGTPREQPSWQFHMLFPGSNRPPIKWKPTPTSGMSTTPTLPRSLLNPHHPSPTSPSTINWPMLSEEVALTVSWESGISVKAKNPQPLPTSKNLITTPWPISSGKWPKPDSNASQFQLMDTPISGTQEN